MLRVWNRAALACGVTLRFATSSLVAQDAVENAPPEAGADEEAQALDQSEGIEGDNEEEAPEPKLAWGYLSDPNVEPKNFYEAFFTGKIYFDNRFRIEWADTTGADSSTAVTNRTRLGYETKPFHGISGFIEMENVATPDRDGYFVPQTGDGSPSRTPIADPPGTEVNQAYGRFDVDSIGDSGIALDFKAGRQRTNLDDQRFVGAVGWRQFEQTLDAVSARTDFGVEDLTFYYAYVWRVQRVFGPDGPNWDSDSHLINASYTVMPELKVTPFIYLLDFSGDSPLDSVNTYGIRLAGEIDRQDDVESDVYFGYEVTYAHQTDAGPNPIDFDADFFALEGRVAQDGLGRLAVGYQFLGSDDGNFGFRFPLGTNHNFQGFADNFLTTPPEGLQDLYITVGTTLPYDIKPSVSFHQFWSDEGGQDLGYEFDFVVSKSITPNWSVLLKAAFFDGHNGEPDTTRLWLQTTIFF